MGIIKFFVKNNMVFCWFGKQMGTKSNPNKWEQFFNPIFICNGWETNFLLKTMGNKLVLVWAPPKPAQEK